jgi:hypothetical protein
MKATLGLKLIEEKYGTTALEKRWTASHPPHPQKKTQAQTSALKTRKITPLVPIQKQHTKTEPNAKEQRVIDLRLILSCGILPVIFCTTYCCVHSCISFKAFYCYSFITVF